MATTAQELLKLKDRIDRAKTERSRLEGELRAIESRMEEEFGTADTTKIKTKLSTLRKEADKLQAQVEEGVAKIEKELK